MPPSAKRPSRQGDAAAGPGPEERGCSGSETRESRKGTNGVSTNGVIANVMFFDRGT